MARWYDRKIFDIKGYSAVTNQSHHPNRMAQYETNYRVPKKDMLKDIAEALDVSPLKLNWPDTCCERGPAYEPCEPKYQWKKSDSETES